MFGVGLSELAVIAFIGILLFGPDKLPEFARQAGRFVKEAKKFADGTRDQLRNELGPEYSDLELRDLNPREFVKKQIDQVLAEDETKGGLNTGKPKSRPLRPGERPPFDSEAT